MPHLTGIDNNTALQLQTCVLDVFTREKYSGNPLAVVFIPKQQRDFITQDVKQRIAREFNLSETIFIHVPSGEERNANSCRIDIFTVNEELPFAGHPIIGAAAVVLNHLGWGIDALDLKAGRFPIRRRITPPLSPDKEGPKDAPNAPPANGLVEVDVVHDMHIHARTLADVVNATGASSATIIAAHLHPNPTIRQAELAAPVVSIVKGMTALLVRLPDLEHLAMVSTAQRIHFSEDIQDLILDQGPWGRSFCYRYYYVPQGVEQEEGQVAVHRIRARMVELATEDPATGSAACTLGAYLATTAVSPSDSMNRFEIVQGVEMGRRSDIIVKVKTQNSVGSEGKSIDSVALSGTAVVVSTGSIHV